VTLLFHALARTGSGGWEPGIGDNTFFGWVAVLCYFAAAGLCFYAWRKEQEAERGGGAGLRPVFWLALAVVMALLGINKQLDLQSWVTAVGRDAAREGGWYESRRGVQLVFVLFVLAAGVVSLVLAYRHIQGAWLRYRLAFLGAAALICFIVLRAASFHHVDVLLKLDLGIMHFNHVLELSGIGTIGYAAWQSTRAAPAPRAKLTAFEKTVRIR
jgi:hypothetical protein